MTKKNNKSYAFTPNLSLPVIWSEKANQYIAYTDCDTVYVGDLFLEMPNFMKEFILLHEEGHVANGDRARIGKIMLVSDLQLMEMAADRYAVEHIGKLKSFVTLYALMCICINKDDMLERALNVFGF